MFGCTTQSYGCLTLAIAGGGRVSPVYFNVPRLYRDYQPTTQYLDNIIPRFGKASTQHAYAETMD